MTIGNEPTTRLVESFLDLLQLGLKFLVLNSQSTIGILKQRFQVLNTLVASEQLALSDTRFLLESRVLIDKLYGAGWYR